MQLEGRGLIIGGDGRADSPGHSAKYGSYTVMELEMGVVCIIQSLIFIFLFFLLYIGMHVLLTNSLFSYSPNSC